LKDTFKINNFDIIRLLAALQVVFHHTVSHLNIDASNMFLFKISSYFPGVPVFFFVSGFLISKSFEKNPNLIEYAQNRALRIFPALIICTLFSITSVYMTGYFINKEFSFIEMGAWLLGQITFVQFYNPEFMRGFGTGVLNGSLWTISVELQFYIALPVVYWLFKLAKPKHNIRLIFLIIFFLLVFMFYGSLLKEYSENILFQLFTVTFSPWFYMFLFGVLFQKNFNLLHKYLAGKTVYLFIIYIASAYYVDINLGWHFGNLLHPIMYIILSALIFSFAYTLPLLSNKILNRNDISYGVYIYHVPIINLFVYYNFTVNINYLCLVIIATLLGATMSWLFIEKASMKFKSHPLFQAKLL
jgi:peptidoglycan/LPS O-acetylase OafA/YrhL